MSDAAARTAVILSGGGALGAYEVGVLRALYEGSSPTTGGKPLDADIFTGTSVGAYNAAIMASQGDAPGTDAVAHLQQLWLERVANSFATCGNGVFRFRADPLAALDPGCLSRPFEVFSDLVEDAVFYARDGLQRASTFATSKQSFEDRFLQLFDMSLVISDSPLHKLIADTVNVEALRGSPKKVTIAASNFKDGKVALFTNQDIGDLEILASASIPAIFPATEIDGTPFVDGGLLMNTPLKPAIVEGAEVLHVIYLDPLLANIPLAEPPNTLDTIYRIFVILSAGALNDDISDAMRINDGLELLENLEQPAERKSVRGLLWSARRILERHQEGRPYRKLTIHRYRPSSVLGGGAEGLLDFERGSIEKLIARGYYDAVNHDCSESGCSLSR